MSNSPTQTHLMDIDAATLDRILPILERMFPPAEVGTSAVSSDLSAEMVLRTLIYAAGARSVIDTLIAARRAMQ